MNTSEMTPQESLNIISEAIRSSRGKLEKNSSAPLIFWGIAVSVFTLIIWSLWHYTGKPQWNLLWFVFSPALSIVQHFTLDKKLEKCKGFINDVLGYVWISFGVFAISAAILGLCGIIQDITLSILLMMGFAATISGLVVKNPWMTAGGLLSGLGLAVALKFVSGPETILLLIPASIFTLLLPGLYLKFKMNK